MKKIILTLSIVIASYFAYSQPYLPLTAGSSNPITGTLLTNISGTIPAILHPVTSNGNESSPYYENLLSYGDASTSSYASILAGNAFNSSNGTYLRFNINARGGTGSPITAMTINPYGNIGIGTTNPPTVGDYSVLALNGRHPSQGGYLSMMMNGNEVGAIIANSQFNFQTASGIATQFYTGSNPTMQIASNGNVGIGTTSPAAKLTVGDATAQTTVGIIGNSAADKGPALAFVRTNGWYQTMPNTTDFSLGYNITSYSDAAILAGSKLYVTSAGKVGIGTTIPDEKLTVKGKIHSQEVIVDAMTTVPDYVFEPDYKLISLTELKRYVDQNHHLPYIPSAKEIEKNGIQIGDMSMKLLKTIEELTLYVIELNNQVKLQTEKITSLEEQLKK